MFLAHISEDKSREQSIFEHLAGTAQLAGEFASIFGCREWGYGCGYLHDIGKYSDSFQKRIKLNGSLTDHSTAGAQEMFRRKNYIAAYCISGHHSGLLDGGSVSDSGGEATLMGRMKKKIDDYYQYKGDIEIPSFPNPDKKALGKGGFSVSFFIRMLFSCLVDADYLDTERFMQDTAAERKNQDSIEILYNRLFTYISGWRENRQTDTINGRRTAILEASIQNGLCEPGLFKMTVPTGGGKTIASLAFALQHARKHHMQRIIYVIPYTSIIEQNAQVFQEILGKENVLEDHCNVVCESEEELKQQQLAAENWEKPVVVTTNVQFFESLFSNKSSKCRKLHNIANSVIIFDEAQMLPAPFLKPCIQAMSELVYNYSSTVVLCSATQPAIGDFFSVNLPVREICPDVEEQFSFFQRNQVKNIGMINQQELIKRLETESQVLCILNNRKLVQKIYESIEGEEVYQLSTLLYPKHRKRLLKDIKEQLSQGKPIKVIATSLVEAGVDFDFKTVYRELAGIDSVIQASGRCNREGRRQKDLCETLTFILEKNQNTALPAELKLPISIAEQIAEKYEDITSLEAIEEYFERLYYLKGEGLDALKIVDQFEDAGKSLCFPFASVAKQFHLIENNTKSILIPKEPEAAEIAERLKRGEASRQLIREAGQYTVNLYQKDFEAFYGAGMLEDCGYELYILRNIEHYSDKVGLRLDVSRGEAVIF